MSREPRSAELLQAAMDAIAPAARANPERPASPLVDPIVRPLLARYGAVIRPLGELPEPAQLAVGTYESWHSPREAIARLRDVPFGYVEIPMRELTSRALRNVNDLGDPTFRSFAEFHRWYAATRQVPDHPARGRWPVILGRGTDGRDGVMEDGWHRFNDYYRKGVKVVPAVFYTQPPAARGARRGA